MPRTAPLWHTLMAVALALLAHPAWAQAPSAETSARRGEICLNGVWRFMPAVGQAAQAPSGDWGEIPVPGAWAGQGAVPGPRSRGQGGAWDAGKLEDVTRVWYETTVRVPAAWRGRAILLGLTRLSTDAVVTANGVECGSIEWPNGCADLTRAVRPGEEARLRLLVVAAPEPKDVAVYMGAGNDQTWTQPARLATRGITGEVFLRSQPLGPHVSDVFVRPSVRRKTLSVDVEVTGCRQAGTAAFTARLLDEQGRVEKSFTAEKALTGAEKQTVALEWPWPNPRLWDLGAPNLYTLQLAVRGAGLDDEYPQPFGFREFRLDGTRFFLNGTEIRLRPVLVRDEWNGAAWLPQAISNCFDSYTRLGFNIGEHWPNDEGERGVLYLRDLWAEAADRKGFLLTGNALSMNGYIMGRNWRFAWDDPGVKQRWEERMDAQLRRLRNHPSIVMWGTSANFFGRHQDQNPRVIGRRAWYPADQKARAGLEGIGIIKRHDPTRPVFTHSGADIGDLHTCNCYLDMTPLQEREEWLSAYVKQAEMPFLPIEFGTPLHATFMRGRSGFGDAVFSEPLMTEFCAIYLGPRAYAMETDAYRQRLESTYEAPQRWRNWHNAPELDQAPAFQALQALFIRNTWRSWRTWGTTAGMLPWSMGHGWAVKPEARLSQASPDATPGQRGPALAQVNRANLCYLQPEGGWTTNPAGQALVETNGATLAWIAGPAESFTAKDHLFESGERVAKQIVLINDERRPLRYRLKWHAVVGGTRVAAGESSGELIPARNAFLPLSFVAPAVARKSEGLIRLTATIGARVHEDTLAFRVFPRDTAAPSGRPVRVYDPEGATSKLLRSLAIPTVAWDGKPHAGELVVVGRHALDGGKALPGSLEGHTAAGGRLVIFGQDPEWLRKSMGLRVARHVSRRFFPVASQAGHPILAGLDADDLRDWRGAGTLVAEAWGGLDDSPNADPEFGWHWGNRGSVSSCAVEKPHFSGWRPLLEGEFDLAYSPLMELRYGSGMALLCTLDLEGRTHADPVALRLARRVLDYARTAKPEPRAASTLYLGGPAGLKLLRGMGVRFEGAEKLPAGRALAIVGGDASVSREDLERFLAGGGRALLLPRSQGGDPWGAVGKEAPFRGATGLSRWQEVVVLSPSPRSVGRCATVAQRKERLLSATYLPAWPECRGLSLSDLRLRGTVGMAPVVAAGGVEVGAGGLLGRRAIGAGVAVLLQLTPEMLPARERSYFRYSQWRLSRAMAQILANLGAAFEMDKRSLTPGWNLGSLPIPLAGEWLYRVERKLPAATDPNARTQDPGVAKEAAAWSAATTGAEGWGKMKLPGYWEDVPGIGTVDGAFWVRRAVSLPDEWAGKDLTLQLGNVDDRDVTWFNGVKVGETSAWNAPRTYAIPARFVRAGRNVVTVRVFDEFGGGGFGGRPQEMRIGPTAARPQPAGEEILSNTGLSDGTKGWNLFTTGTAQATLVLDSDTPDELLGQRSLKLDVARTSDTSWHVSVGQPGFGIRAGTAYIWSAWMKASKPCTLIAAIEKDHPPHGSAGLFERVSVGPQWKRVELPFTPRESDDKVRFSFQELAREVAAYWFAAPSFSVAPAPGAPRRTEGLATFYVPDFIESHALGDDPYRYYRW